MVIQGNKLKDQIIVIQGAQLRRSDYSNSRETTVSYEFKIT